MAVIRAHRSDPIRHEEALIHSYLITLRRPPTASNVASLSYNAYEQQTTGIEKRATASSLKFSSF